MESKVQCSLMRWAWIRYRELFDKRMQIKNEEDQKISRAQHLLNKGILIY